MTSRGRGWTAFRRGLLPCALALTLVAKPGVVQASQDCVGDCDANARVTASDLVRMISVAVGNTDASTCIAGDANSDDRITEDEIGTAIHNVFGGCAPVEPHRTLDDLFEDVARMVPDFGGMLLADNEHILQVYLLDPSPEKLAAVASAITSVFGNVIPQGGIQALPGQYGFAQLRGWYRAMVERVLSVPGVTATDINEAINRLSIEIATPEVEFEVVAILAELGIPNDAVAIVVTGPIEPFSHTVRDVQSPRRGGYQIVRLINNTAGFGIVTPTLSFNATRSGVPGFVTNSHNTQRLWTLDTNAGFPPADFYQAPGYFPAEWVGTEAADPQAFVCPPPYPSGHWCRYSDSAFVKYNTGVAFDPGIIGKTTGQTTLSSTSANLILTTDHAAKFTVVAPPTQPYLVGLQLHKVGRTTGWTSGSIVSTCVDYTQTNPAIHPGTTVRLCQYVVAAPPMGLATFGDSGSPVFRVIDPQCGYVELYGLLWGGGDFFVPPSPWPGGSVGKMFVFSPIGGVPFQQTGVQSSQDLGTLGYTTAPGMCTTPTATASATASRTRTPTPTVIRPCDFIGPRMCGGSCPNSTDVCLPLPDDTACVCQPGQPIPTETATATFTRPPSFTPTVTMTPGGPATPTVTPTGCASGPLPNLVLNPSFESYSSIPVGLGQLSLATPWDSPTNASPDSFHALATAASSVSVPANAFGSEAAHSGNAYAGFHARPSNLYREYVEGLLSSPLAAGSTYQVSFYVSLADGSRWAIDKLGAHFSAGSVGPVSTAYFLPLTSHVSASGYVTTKTGWTQILGSYTAVGGEDHIVIGNFFDNPSTTPLMGLGGPYDFAYYYLDDVSVSLVPPQCTPTPTATVVATCPGAMCTPTPTPSRTLTPTRTPSPSFTPSTTASATTTATRTATATVTHTPSPSVTSSATPGVTPTCVTPLAGMVAWWPLDDAAGSTSVVDIASPPTNNGVPQPGPVVVSPPGGPLTVAGNLALAPPDRALFFYTPATYAEVPPSSDLDLANSDLTIDAWVIPLPGPWSANTGNLHIYTVVDKLNLATNSGYDFYVEVQSTCPTCPPPPGGAASTTQMRLVFAVGNGATVAFYTSAPFYTGTGTVFPFPTPASPLTPQPPSSIHVAVTVDRSQNMGKFYIGGSHLVGSDFTPVTGANNTAPMWIGGSRLYGTAHAPNFSEFTLNEIEIFNIALPPLDLQSIGTANGGKCKPTPTPSATPTHTLTRPPSPTATVSSTATRTPSLSPTRTPTETASVTRTPTITPTATPTCITPPSDMVAWWTADNTTNDLSGNGNTGVLHGAAGYVAGQVGSAFSLPTIAEFVQVPNDPTLNFSGNFSIDAWIRTNNAPTARATIVDKRSGTNTNPVGYHLFIFQGALGFQLADGQPFLNQVSPGPLVNDGNWHHVAATINRGSTTGGNLYVDGQLIYTFDPTTRPGSIINSSALRLGVRTNGSPQTFENFQGAIDEVELFDRELLSSEVQAIYRAQSVGKCKTPLPTRTATRTITRTPTITVTPTATPRPSQTRTSTASPSFTRTPTVTFTPTPTTTRTSTRSFTPTLTPTCVPTPPNLRAWWTADNTTTDRSGNGYNAAFFQGPGMYTTGMVGAAFSLSALTDFVEVPILQSQGLNPSGNFSIDAWIRTTSAGQVAVVDKRQNAGFAPVGYFLFVLGGQLGFELGDGQPPLVHVAATPFVNDGNWHLVAATIDRTSTTGGKLYVDGAPVYTFDPTLRPGSISSGGWPFRIGQGYLGTVAFSGAIDEVELFDRDLTSQEVLTIFNAGSAGKCKNPSPTPTVSGTATRSSTPSRTLTGTPTFTKTPTATLTRTSTATVTSTRTITQTATVTQSATNTVTLAPTLTRTITATRTASPTITRTPTITVTRTPTATVGCPAGLMCTLTPTNTPSATPTPPCFAELCVFKFNDLDRDGIHDAGEPGIAGWMINIAVTGGQIVSTVTTGAQGSICTGVGAPASYTISEVLQAGWTQTFPAPPGTHAIGIDCGQLVNLEFGNVLSAISTPTRSPTPSVTATVRTPTHTSKVPPPD